MCFNCAESIQRIHTYRPLLPTHTHTQPARIPYSKYIARTFRFLPCAISECFPTCFELATIAITLWFCCQLKNHSLAFPSFRSFRSFRSLCVSMVYYVHITALYRHRPRRPPSTSSSYIVDVVVFPHLPSPYSILYFYYSVVCTVSGSLHTSAALVFGEREWNARANGTPVKLHTTRAHRLPHIYTYTYERTNERTNDGFI